MSIGQSGLENLKTYIEKKEEHHKKLSFKEKILKFLRKYKVEYDDRYLWD